MNGEKRAGLAFFIAIIALAFFAFTMEAEDSQLPGSVTNVYEDGRRAANSLLTELEIAAGVWRQAPGTLQGVQAALWLAKAPATLGLERETDDAGQPLGEGHALLGLLHDPLGYLDFVTAGGTLVLPASEDAVGFLTGDLGLDEFVGVLLEGAGARAETTAQLPGGEELTLAWRTGEIFDLEDIVSPVERILVDASGRALIVAATLGTGRIVLLGDDHFLANETLGDLDHGLLLVRLAEELAPGLPVLFDEYALGRWAPVTKSQLALGPRFLFITLHCALLAGLFAWRHAWVRGFPRDPEPLAALAPLARARSGAALFARAGRFDLLAERLVRGSVLVWLRRLRLRPGTGAGTAEGAFERAALTRIAERVGAEEELPGWGQALSARVGSASDLERIEETLLQIERCVGKSS